LVVNYGISSFIRHHTRRDTRRFHRRLFPLLLFFFAAASRCAPPTRRDEPKPPNVVRQTCSPCSPRHCPPTSPSIWFIKIPIAATNSNSSNSKLQKKFSLLRGGRMRLHFNCVGMVFQKTVFGFLKFQCHHSIFGSLFLSPYQLPAGPRSICSREEQIVPKGRRVRSAFRPAPVSPYPGVTPRA